MTPAEMSACQEESNSSPEELIFQYSIEIYIIYKFKQIYVVLQMPIVTPCINDPYMLYALKY